MASKEEITVLHVIHSLAAEAGGPSRTVPALCNALQRGGAKVVLLTSRGAEQTNLLPSECEESVEIEWTGARWTSGLKRSFDSRIQELHRRYRFDVIHDHGQWLASNRAAAAAGRALNIPRVVSPRGMLSPWARKHHWLKKALAWALFARHDLASAQCIHATSELEANELRGLAASVPIRVVPNGFSIPSDFAVTPTRSQSRREILFLSRLHPKKGLVNLIEAWSRLRPSGWRIVIAGPDENNHRHQLEQLISLKGLRDDFEFVGAVDGNAKLNLYAAASLFVLPSFSENFGVVVADALAAGVPVITTRTTPWGLIETHRCGWWIEPTVDGVETALRQACSLPTEELEAMGQRARIAVKAFCWDSIASSMLEVYDEIQE